MMLVEIGIQECYAYEIISHIIKSLLLANNSIPGPDRRAPVRLGGDRTPAKTKSLLGQARAGHHAYL